MANELLATQNQSKQRQCDEGLVVVRDRLDELLRPAWRIVSVSWQRICTASMAWLSAGADALGRG